MSSKENEHTVHIVNTFGKGPFEEDRLPTTDELHLDHPRNHGILGRPRHPPLDYHPMRLYQHLSFESKNAYQLLQAVYQHADEIPSYIETYHIHSDNRTKQHRQGKTPTYQREEILKNVAYYQIACQELYKHVVRCIRLLPYVAHKAGKLYSNSSEGWKQTRNLHDSCQKALRRVYKQYEQDEDDEIEKNEDDEEEAEEDEDEEERPMKAKGLLTKDPQSLGALWYEINLLRWELHSITDEASPSEPRELFFKRAYQQFDIIDDSDSGSGSDNSSNSNSNSTNDDDDIDFDSEKKYVHPVTAGETYGAIEGLWHDIHSHAKKKYNKGFASAPDPQENEDSSFFHTRLHPSGGLPRQMRLAPQLKYDPSPKKDNSRSSRQSSSSSSSSKYKGHKNKRSQRRRKKSVDNMQTKKQSNSKIKNESKTNTKRKPKNAKRSKGGSSGGESSDTVDSPESANELAQEFEPLDKALEDNLERHKERLLEHDPLLWQNLVDCFQRSWDDKGKGKGKRRQNTSSFVNEKNHEEYTLYPSTFEKVFRDIVGD
jgi:hypothetical protein